ncbi:MAG TPA: hypothetical protein VM241_05010 [Candidatus Thermoplasmatota archaeon]|nr:hypothetical protein [Candidatus Thermoplasmatota archaeon]
MQGYTSRVLAFAATVLGFVGLAVTLAGGPVVVAGLAVAALALLGLLALTWLATDTRFATVHGETVGEPTGNPDFEYAGPDLFPHEENEGAEEEWAAGLPEPPASEEPVIDLDSPLQRALAGLPPKPAAPGRYSPRMPVIPEAEEEAEPVRRARRLVPSGQTLGEKRDAARKAKARPPPEDMEFTVVPAPARAARPAVASSEKIPLAVARVAGKGPVPADLARGKCSGCGTLLWAPKARPLSLRCPQCDKMTLLR